MAASRIPSVVRGAPPARPEPTRLSPQALGPVPDSPPPAARSPARASALAGVRRLPFAATRQELETLFPGAGPEVLQQARLAVAAAPLSGAAPAAWLRYGEPAQQALAELVRQRLQLADEQPLRLVPALLAQLQARLAQVLEALQGGVFRRSAARVWRGAAAEIGLLEQRLGQSLAALQQLHQRLEDLMARARAAQQGLLALDMACAFLMHKVAEPVRPALAARAVALAGSQALALEQLQLLEADKSALHQLMLLVQDGVLLRLPALLSQLAPLDGPLRPALNQTQRLLLADALRQFKAFIEQGLKP